MHIPSQQEANAFHSAYFAWKSASDLFEAKMLALIEAGATQDDFKSLEGCDEVDRLRDEWLAQCRTFVEH